MTSPLLRVGFFGSDVFSIHCLAKILPLYLYKPQIISHLDIITRKPKPSGRGLTELKDVPISQFAQAQGLNVLRADTAEDFNKIQEMKYDLCIAVSYGRLIPASFIKSLPFGGLNVHPSLLPRYSGPAPLQRALLDQTLTTGVTVQTLHPTEFDKGEILAQAKYNIPASETIDSLSANLAAKGGDMLKQIIETQAYDPKSKSYQVLKPDYPYSYASKIQKTEHQIDWQFDTSFDIGRMINTLGPLYTFKSYNPKNKSKPQTNRRVVISEFTVPPKPVNFDAPAGSYTLYRDDPEKLLVKTSDGALLARHFNVESLGTIPASRLVNSSKKLFGNTDQHFKSLDS